MHFLASNRVLFKTLSKAAIFFWALTTIAAAIEIESSFSRYFRFRSRLPGKRKSAIMDNRLFL